MENKKLFFENPELKLSFIYSCGNEVNGGRRWEMEMEWRKMEEMLVDEEGGGGGGGLRRWLEGWWWVEFFSYGDVCLLLLLLFGSLFHGF